MTSATKTIESQYGRIIGDRIEVNLFYPRQQGEPRTIQVGLYDVRAADDIQIEYDFERDGWSIKQASCFQWASDDNICDPDWQEVAFVQAFGRERKTNGLRHQDNQ